MVDNLEYYKVFYYVAGTGSITEAAKRLTLTQPAVSQAVKQLERLLGVKLFYRVSRGMKLSGEGQLLYSYVEKGYEQIEQGVRKVKQMQNLELGEIHIGASDMTLRFYLLPYLEQFHERYPGIKVKVTNAPTPETLAFLEQGKIDFGVVSTPFAGWTGQNGPGALTGQAGQGGPGGQNGTAGLSGIEAEPVREMEDIFVAGRRFISLKNKMLDFQELQSLPLIFLEKNTSTRSYMDQFLLENSIVVQPEFELATSDMIVQFALRSLGIGCVVRDFAQEYLDSGVLFELFFTKMIPKRQFCVVRNTKMPVSAAAGQLLGMIRRGGSSVLSTELCTAGGGEALK